MKTLLLLLILMLMSCSDKLKPYKNTPNLSTIVGNCYRYYVPEHIANAGKILNKVNSVQYFDTKAIIVKYTYVADVRKYFNNFTHDKTGLGVFEDFRNSYSFKEHYSEQIECSEYESFKKGVELKLRLRDIESRLKKIEKKSK